MKKLSFRSNGIHQHFIRIHFNEAIKVKKEYLQYGYFDMMVEIGSSLGLWLGLSAIDLVAYKLHLFQKIKNLCKRLLKPK